MNFLSRLFFVYLLFSLLLASGISAQTTIKTFPFEGISRSARVYVPASYTPGTPAPLVFNLHGYTSNAQQQEFYSQMNAVADTAGFIVVYPDGIAATWNAGFGLVNTNDVGFISILIDSMQANYDIDLSRVYSCGMSMGGFMSFYLACELDDRIAAIASVTGLFATNAAANCSATRKVPILQMHGTLDGVVSYTGSNGILSVDSTLNWWRNHNGCTAAPVYDTLPDLVNEGSTITTQYYGGCQDNVEILHYKVHNGSHSWPGALPLVSGITNQDIEGSVEIWNFFLKFTHPSPLLTGIKPKVDQKFPPFYPQPAREYAHIPAYDQAYELIITDLRGKQIGNWAIAAHQELMIHTERWPNGVYLAHYKSTRQEITRKFIVQ